MKKIVLVLLFLVCGCTYKSAEELRHNNPCGTKMYTVHKDYPSVYRHLLRSAKTHYFNHVEGQLYYDTKSGCIEAGRFSDDYFSSGTTCYLIFDITSIDENNTIVKVYFGDHMCMYGGTAEKEAMIQLINKWTSNIGESE